LWRLIWARAMALRVNELTVAYGSHLALRKVSLEVGERELVALIGANGAGKTTLINAVSGLKKILKGSIEWRGERIDGRRPDEIGRLGLIQVPEGRKLFPRMTVLENLDIGAYAREARADKMRSLAMVWSLFPRLKERQKQMAGTLSGGEQQMAALGRALMARPQLLMLDEPTEGLAPKAAGAIFEVIQRLNQEGLGVVLVSQEVRQSLALADRAYCFENGGIALSGTGAALLRDPAVREAYLGI
jgi:branched-chain amino acid transport system ATP-binding protein